MTERINISEKVEHLYRAEYGKLVAVLTKTFGAANIELAEDVVQEAMVEALKKWEFSGVPDNPVGWIYQVAKYKAVNIVNREKNKHDYASQAAALLQSEWTMEPAINHIFSDQEIADDQLRMIFTCCHPAISIDSQVALTLKTLCGFSIPELAKAFLTTEENINKRLVRARKTIRNQSIPFEVPAGKSLEERLSSVLETIYLLFNEGYNASSGEEIIRYELCEEAIRLAEIVASSKGLTSKANVYALLALMSLNASRFSSRMDEWNNMVNLANQDRSQWNQHLIKKGLYYLEYAATQNEVSVYHLLATISAQHCTAKDFESTNWVSILSMYDLLLTIDPSPVVMLNRAVALYKVKNAKTALGALDQIENEVAFRNYLPYFMVKAELHFQNGDQQKAITLLNKGLKLPGDKKYKRLIINKIKSFSEKK